jgi:uncharacterized protein YjiS (DUF1127 family)
VHGGFIELEPAKRRHIMTILTGKAQAAFTSLAGKAADKRPGLFARLNALWRNRRETRALLDMNDSQLADIGLTRDDVRHALRQPLTHDPSRELARARGR